MDKDVTKEVGFGNPDDEHLPITKCVCGKEFRFWSFVISIYRDNVIKECSDCHRKFYFRNSITIYEVKD